MTRRLVIAGGSGFIGRLLGKSLVEGDFEVVVLTRSHDEAATPIHKVQWDGARWATGPGRSKARMYWSILPDVR